ncbi:MAG: B12-binding domain-containing radical SAM protein [Kiritimatiellales bacterium]|nr:B12-binding domain-containing radical SAM protein [Kiritimatiellales bacterium]
MKILFIYPNTGSQLGFNYGVAHMSAILKEQGHEVELMHLCEELAPLPSQEEFCASLKSINPDVIGFSVVTNQWNYTVELARWCRQTVDAPLVCGGIHATVAEKKALESGLFDYLFKGECDEAFAEFIQRLENGESVDDVRNMGRVVDGAVKMNLLRPLPDLGNMPMKDYSIFDFQKMIDAKHGWVGLMASRGCPYACTYCFNHVVVDMYRKDLQCSASGLNYIRYAPVEQMMEEIRFLEKNYTNIDMYIFDDDLFTFNRDYLVEFCAAYKKTTRIPFVVNGHVGLFDEERARALADAGCKIVKFGLESGSQKIRGKVMNRHMTNANIAKALDLVRDCGMHSSVFVMIGLPHEDLEDLWGTVNLLATARPGRFRWTFFFPFPGTKAHEIALDGGFIDEEKMKNMVNFTDASCLRFSEEQDLLLQKIGKILPWFVNARADGPAAESYKMRANEIMAMDAAEWEIAAPGLCDEDVVLSQQMVDAGHSHYAIKYNRFMGVLSDYFLNEK